MHLSVIRGKDVDALDEVGFPDGVRAGLYGGGLFAGMGGEGEFFEVQGQRPDGRVVDACGAGPWSRQNVQFRGTFGAHVQRGDGVAGAAAGQPWECTPHRM